jgi:hypothetical protein
VLGVEIRQMENGSLHLSQSNYIQKIVRKYGRTSWQTDTKFTAPRSFSYDEDGELLNERDKSWYHSAVGAILFVTVSTRVDAAMYTSFLAKSVSKPTVKHAAILDSLIIYLDSTRALGLSYSVSNDDELMESLMAFSDADHAADLTDRRSRTGAIVVLLGEPIHWITRKQTLVALATAAAELIASVDTIKIMLEIRVTLYEVFHRFVYQHGSTKLPRIKMRMDNTSAISEITAGEFLNGANKHLAVRFLWVRQLWEEDELDLG